MAFELSHERRVFLLAVLAGLPGSALGLVLLWMSDWDTPVRVGVAGIVVLGWLGLARAVQARVAHSLLTLGNVLGAVRGGDFSVRGRAAGAGDSLGLAFRDAATGAWSVRNRANRACFLGYVRRPLQASPLRWPDKDRLRGLAREETRR